MAAVRKISVREEVYRLLQELQARYGATSVSDTILLLAERARVCEAVEQRLRAVEEKLARLDELEAGLRRLHMVVARLLEELGKG